MILFIRRVLNKENTILNKLSRIECGKQTLKNTAFITEAYYPLISLSHNCVANNVPYVHEI